jgi:3-dehydroquinate synthetase
MNVAISATGTTLDHDMQFGDFRYPFRVRSGRAAKTELAGRLAEMKADQFLLVVDGGVPDAAVQATTTLLAGACAKVSVLRVPASEKAKTITTVDGLAGQAIRAGATRNSVVISLGGGLAGNVAGLLSALLFRGIRLVHMPTTLLALSDSVLSLKQAVNSGEGKNHLGVFKTAEMVWGDLDFLDTLPAAEVRAALCEAVKNVLAVCPERYAEMASRLRPDGVYTAAEIAWFISMCVDAKQSVMGRDPFERREALVLEYGHTAGHAAEHLTSGAFAHGPAIGVGMLVAARISASLGFLGSEDEKAHELLLALNGTPVMFPAGLPAESILAAMRLDNKRGYIPARDRHIDMILLNQLGQPHLDRGGIITQVPEDVVLAAIRTRTTPGGSTS